MEKKANVSVFLKNNRLLAAVGALLCMVLIGLIWRYSLICCLDKVQSVQSMEEDFQNKTERLADNVLQTEQGMYLVDNKNGDALAGPFASILYEDFYREDDVWCNIARFTAPDGLFGYVNTEGTIIAPPIYSKALPFKEWEGIVLDTEGNVYKMDIYGEMMPLPEEETQLI